MLVTAQPAQRSDPGRRAIKAIGQTQEQTWQGLFRQRGETPCQWTCRQRTGPRCRTQSVGVVQSGISIRRSVPSSQAWASRAA